MNKIIVPMDFGKASENALKYAVSMFGRDSDITVVHVTKGILDVNTSITPNILESTIAGLKRRLFNIITNVMKHENFSNTFKVEILLGNPVFSIAEYVKDNDGFDAMVLATREHYDLLDRWMGTVSLGLVKKLNIPIYLIPIYSSFNNFEKVMVASDYELKNTKAIINIAQWNKTYNAMIKFLHIYTGNDNSYEEERRNVLTSLFNDNKVKFNYEIDFAQGSDIPGTLLGEAYNYKADLLIAIPEHHSFLYTLLFKSISKELILKSNIPILFIPNNSPSFKQKADQKEWLSSINTISIY